jgi:hypothetical protein
LNKGPERGEDLGRGECGGQTIDYSQRRLGNASGMEGPAKGDTTHTTRCIFIGVFGLRLGCDRHEPLQDYGGEASALNLRLLTTMGHERTIIRTIPR